MAVTIKAIEEHSPAKRAGLAPGMQLVSVDGHEIRDGLDYEFFTAVCDPALVVEQAGQQHRLSVHKEEQEPLGCVFETYLIDRQHRCQNNCVFCFIDQLPNGLRPSLYFKDDDERLGFLFGNYITLTNLGEREIERIIDMRFSPVNVSVHTVNAALRCEMMGSKRAGQALSYLPRLAEAGILLNAQMVLCPGLNDGPELEKSIEWLAKLHPALQSMAAVPVGITKHRAGLPKLSPYTKEEAGRQLDIMLAYGERYLREKGTRLVFPSDEWFLLAGRPLPDDAFYEGYPQLENGVGMWRLLHDEFAQALDEREEPDAACEADVVSGVLAAPLMEQLAGELNRRFPQSKLHIHTVKNDFFGPHITVAGLLVGQDIVAQLRGKLATGHLVLPANMLRPEGDLFLDGMSCEEMENELGVRVHVVSCDGAALLEEALKCTA